MEDIVEPRSPLVEILDNYDNEAIEDEVEKVHDGVLISESLKIIACNGKRSEHKTFVT